MLDLVSSKVGDKNLALKTPWKGRVVLFGIALLFACMMVVDRRFSPVPFVLASLSGLAGFYTEKWLFDGDQERILHTVGLPFWRRKTSFAIRDVVRVESRNSIPGRGGGTGKNSFILSSGFFSSVY